MKEVRYRQSLSLTKVIRSGSTSFFTFCHPSDQLLEKMVDLRKRGFTLGGRRKKVTGEVLERMRNLRKERVPKKEIADRLNLSYGTVLMYLRREELGLVEKLKRKLGLK